MPRFPQSGDEKLRRLQLRIANISRMEETTGGEVERTAAARLAAANAQAGSKGVVPPGMVGGIASALTNTGLETVRRLASGELRIDDLELSSLNSLEAVVDAVERPAWNVVSDAPDIVLRAGRSRASDEVWASVVNAAQKQLRRICSRTGVIAKLRNDAAVPLATGWMIGPRTIVTNAHVAQLIAYRQPGLPATDRRDRWRMSDDANAVIDFAFERGRTREARIAIADVLYVETSGVPDIAMFRLADTPAAPDVIKVDMVPRACCSWSGSRVFVVGHPIADLRNDTNVAQVFGAIDGTKRFSPGEVRGVLGTDTLDHDCSTTNGSSGSPVMDFTSLKAIGLHYFGEPGERNEAMLFAAYADHPAVARSIAGDWE